jgi:hypothetical protein
MKNIVLIATVLAGAPPAFADDNAWGTPEDTEKCVKELTDSTKEFVNGSWVSFGHRVNGKYVNDNKVYEPDNASGDCKAEVAKRVDVCLKDPAIAPRLKPTNEDNKYNAILKKGGADGPRLICADEAFNRIGLQRKKALADKAAAEERKANAEKAELPKAAKKDASLEKAITTTFKKAFPDAKVIRVIIIDKDWATERNNFGTIIGRNIQAAVIEQQKGEELCEIYNELWFEEYIGGHFKSSVDERGAGSLQRTPIVCSKAK